MPRPPPTTTRELVYELLDWDEYPDSGLIIDAVSRFSQHRQPFQVFYHAIRQYVRAYVRWFRDEPIGNQIHSQFFSYYYHYNGSAADLRSGRHNNAFDMAAFLMFRDGYRARVIRDPSRRTYYIIDVVPPDRCYMVLPESAAAA